MMPEQQGNSSNQVRISSNTKPKPPIQKYNNIKVLKNSPQSQLRPQCEDHNCDHISHICSQFFKNTTPLRFLKTMRNHNCNPSIIFVLNFSQYQTSKCHRKFKRHKITNPQQKNQNISHTRSLFFKNITLVTMSTFLGNSQSQLQPHQSQLSAIFHNIKHRRANSKCIT